MRCLLVARELRVMRVIARMNVGGPALQGATLMSGLPATAFEQRLCADLVGPGKLDYVALRAPDKDVHRLPTPGTRIGLCRHVCATGSLEDGVRRFRLRIAHTDRAGN